MSDKASSAPNTINEQSNIADSQVQSFNYQLDFLKMEYQAINEMIKRIDEITQKNKDWAVLIWAGSISGAISKVELRQYVILTAILPLLFWFLDAWWRRIQRTGAFRIEKISDFLNGPQLVESFKKHTLVDFHVVDPRSRKYKSLPDLKQYSRVSRTMWFKEVAVFYIGLITVSLALGIFFLVVPQT